jgi:hypothetical protein
VASTVNTSYEPPAIPLTQFPEECLCYIYPFGLAVHLAIFIVGCVVLLILPHKRRGMLKQRIRNFGKFMTLLLLVAAFFNGLWSCSVWGWLYYSIDYFCDYSPFWPITQSVIDDQFGDRHGELFGVSLFHLQLVWLLFAVGTWSATIYLFRLVRHRVAAEPAQARTDGGKA